MLMLARKQGEAIMIGDEVRVVIVKIEGGQIRVGIEAPLEIPVHREEIYLRLHRGLLRLPA